MNININVVHSTIIYRQDHSARRSSSRTYTLVYLPTHLPIYLPITIPRSHPNAILHKVVHTQSRTILNLVLRTHPLIHSFAHSKTKQPKQPTTQNKEKCHWRCLIDRMRTWFNGRRIGVLFVLGLTWDCTVQRILVLRSN